MNWKNTICGLALVGAAAFLGCDEKPKAVEENKVEYSCKKGVLCQELKYEEKLDYDVEYQGKNFTIKIETSEGNVTFGHNIKGYKGYGCEDSLSLYFDTYEQIISNCRDEVTKYYNGLYGSCHINGDDKCSSETLAYAKGKMEEWKERLNYREHQIKTGEKLDYEVKSDVKYGKLFIEAESSKGDVELYIYLDTPTVNRVENSDLALYFNNYLGIVEITDLNNDGKADSIYNNLYGKCYGHYLKKAAKKVEVKRTQCPEGQLEEASRILEEYKGMLDFDKNLEDFKKKLKEAEEEANKPKNYLEGI